MMTHLVAFLQAEQVLKRVLVRHELQILLCCFGKNTQLNVVQSEL